MILMAGMTRKGEKTTEPKTHFEIKPI